MASPNLDVERAARALVDALFEGDRKAAEKHGIHARSLRNYRRRVDPESSDYVPELAARFNDLLIEAKKADTWAPSVETVLGRTLRTLDNLCRRLDEDPVAHRNPEMVRAVTEAVTALTEADLMRRAVEARLRMMEEAYGEPADDGLDGDRGAAPLEIHGAARSLPAHAHGAADEA